MTIPTLACYLIAAAVLGIAAEKGTPPAPFGTCTRFWKKNYWRFRRWKRKAR